jgi:gentisate 1,2-dioxygenase
MSNLEPETIFTSNSRLYEYTSAANPSIPKIPVKVFPSDLYNKDEIVTSIIPLDISNNLNYSYPATSPNLLANFIKIKSNNTITTPIGNTTSQMFYVIKGSGYSIIKNNMINWRQGDVFVVPHLESCSSIHHCSENRGDSVLYWVNDEPLMNYLGVKPSIPKFQTTHFFNSKLRQYVEELKHNPETKHRNRCGVLLGISETENNTKTLTHTMWSLLNLLPANTSQPPHKHNSVALDLCTYAKDGVNGNCDVYTLMGPELEKDGKTIKNPVRVPWTSGGVFITPPGWWHSHHNETVEDAWVLPVQDAGLHTHMQTLDIQFVC